jgi:hypothetical protein
VILEEVQFDPPLYTVSAEGSRRARFSTTPPEDSASAYFFFRAPLLILTPTAVFRGSVAPGRLVCENTRPFLTFALNALVTAPSLQCFAFKTVRA